MRRLLARLLDGTTDFRVIRVVRRLRTDENGVTAVEFAIIAIPFFMLVFGILEVSLMYFASSYLDASVSRASREVFTGSMSETAQSQGATSPAQKKALFIDKLKTYMPVFLDGGKVDVCIAPVKTFTAVDVLTKQNPDKSVDKTNCTVDFGQAGDMMAVRAYYNLPIYTTFISDAFANGQNNTRLLASTAVFRNEPYAQ